MTCQSDCLQSLFTFEDGAYFAQVTAKYNLFTSLQKTETQAIKEGLLDSEDTDLKSKIRNDDLFFMMKFPCYQNTAFNS